MIFIYLKIIHFWGGSFIIAIYIKIGWYFSMSWRVVLSECSVSSTQNKVILFNNNFFKKNLVLPEKKLPTWDIPTVRVSKLKFEKRFLPATFHITICIGSICWISWALSTNSFLELHYLVSQSHFHFHFSIFHCIGNPKLLSRGALKLSQTSKLGRFA